MPTRTKMSTEEKFESMKSIFPSLAYFNGPVRMSVSHLAVYYQISDNSLNINKLGIDPAYELAKADPVHAAAGLNGIVSHELGHWKTFTSPGFLAILAAEAESVGKDRLGVAIRGQIGKAESFLHMVNALPKELMAPAVELYISVVNKIERQYPDIFEAAAQLYAISKSGFDSFIDQLAVSVVITPMVLEGNPVIAMMMKAMALARHEGGESKAGSTEAFLAHIGFDKWKDKAFTDMAAVLCPEAAQGVKMVTSFNTEEIAKLVAARADELRKSVQIARASARAGKR